VNGAQQTERSRILLEAFVAVVLFGCIPVVVRSVEANAWTIGIVRLAIATAGLYLILRARGALTRVSRRDLLRLAVIGLFFFGHWLTYFFAIKISSASVGTIGLSTYGIFLLLLGALFRRARLHAIDVVAVAMAVSGAVAIVPRFDVRDEVTAGMLLASLSALLYASLPLLHQRYSSIPSSARALGQFGFALAFFLLFLPAAEWDLRPIDWGGLAFLGVGSTLIGHSLWVRVTTRLSPAATSVIYYGSVPVAIALSVALLGEPLTPRIAAGALLIVAGGITGLISQWRRNVLEADRG
jgi:drug/metabolite transporter (DMT)-like permease